MRATEFITELFRPGQDINFKWSRPYKDEVNVLGKTPQGHELSINFWEITDDIVAIDFTIDADIEQDPDPDSSPKSGHELTRHGEEFAVFTQVVNAITQYLNKLPKNNVFFQVKRTEAQREPLYLKIANRVAKQLGFRHGTAQELEATNPGLYNKFDNRYSKLLWYTKEQQGIAEGRENVEHFNGLAFSIEIEKDDEYVDDDDTDNQTIYVKAFANGRELGHVLFTIDYDGQGMILKPQDLEVDERYRGQGIAQTMYDFVKSKGYKIRRSGQQTDAGRGFWDKHRPEQNVWEEESLTELYEPESSFPLNWYPSDYPNEASARAYDRNRGYIDIKFTPVGISKGMDAVEVEFSRNDSYDMTGGGDANRVLGTVLEAFRQYLKNYQPKILIFSSKGASRSKVYQNLINRFASTVGYKQFDINKLNPNTQAAIRMGAGGDVMVLRKMYNPQVTEAPLADYQTMGDFEKPGPFRGVDKKLVPYDFRLFFSNIPGTGRYSEYGPMEPQVIQEIFKTNAEQILAGHEDAITVVFVGNKGDSKVMLTPWMMAHRIGHAVQAGRQMGRDSGPWKAAEQHLFNTMNGILNEYYGKPGNNRYDTSIDWSRSPEYSALFNYIGTQRSSRQGEIRRPYEFLYELFAQYLGTGRIQLNPLPESLGYGRQAWGKSTRGLYLKPDYRDEASRTDATDILAGDMQYMFDDVLSSLVGKILVM